MSKQHTSIVPGIGLGDITFGMSREEVEQLLGTPQAKTVTSYDDSGEDLSDSWEYHELRLDLSFEEEEDWRLSIISASSEDYTLEGKELIGLEMEELLPELAELQINDLVVEDLEGEHPESQLISSEATGMNFWLNKGILEEIQWGPLFLDEHTIDWPKK